MFDLDHRNHRILARLLARNNRSRPVIDGRSEGVSSSAAAGVLAFVAV
jgi:hypothetical protein